MSGAENTGAEFQDADVVRAYARRTDYPTALHARLMELAPGRARLADLGCGPGKLARVLAPGFEEVLAIDPSAEMLRLGRELDDGANANIRWIESLAEDAPLEGPVDLVVAGASLHWMDAPRLFPKLADVMAKGGVMAIVDGDGPAQAPWIEAWRQVTVDWVGRMGGVWNGEAHRARTTAHEPWFEALGSEVFSAVVRQPIEELIDAEHSRATWARAKMGNLAASFDEDLRRVLAPYAQDGAVVFTVESRLVWGRPRMSPVGGGETIAVGGRSTA